MAVPEVMETDPRNVLHSACDLGEFVGEASRRHWIAIRATEGQRLAGLTNAERQQFLGLLALEPAQFLNNKAREGDGPRLLSLGSLKP